MRLTLVQPPNGYLDHYDLAPPLGLLSMAAVLIEDSVEVSIVDFNLRGMQDPSLVTGGFYDRAVEAVAETRPDVVGFTSMALESHVCLELARRLKDRDQRIVMVFGGPHFSAIARPALALYPWVDHVVTGEGEIALRSLLRWLRGVDSELPPNVATRRGDTVELRRELQSNGSLDDLPPARYDLVNLDEYFALNPARLLNVDSSRGCIFRCSFCYSPGHWGQGEQKRSSSKVAEEVQRLHALGARHLFFVQDNLVNSAAAAKELCQDLVAAGTQITWNAYATLPRLTPDMLDELAAAGCTEVFVGVDAVSLEAKRAFGKHFFKGWSELKPRLTACLDRGIVPTCAFMVDVPEDGDYTGTDAALLTALLTRNLGCGIRLNTLTLYNETATEQQFADHPRHYTELKPRLLLDTPPVISENPYAAEHPELFPFHSTVLPLETYTRFVSGMHAAYTLFTSFSRTLLRYAVGDGHSLWELLDRVVEQVGDLVAVEPRQRRPLERKIFVAEFAKLSVSASTRDAFELELAELRVSLTGHSPPVQVTSAQTDGWYRSQAHQVVRLGEQLSQLARDDDAGRIGRPGSYLVLREGGLLRYFEVDEGVVDGLNRIGLGAAAGESVPIPADVLARLTEARLLTPI